MLKKKVKYSYFHFTHLLTLPQTSLLIYVQFISNWEATQIWWLWHRHRHEHQMKFREFIYDKILAWGFNNFVCTISLWMIIHKFLQIPWPDVHINNLESFNHVLTHLILLHKNTHLKKVQIGIKLNWISKQGFTECCYKGFLVRS